MKPQTICLDPVYTSTDPNGSLTKLAQIGLPFTLDLCIRTHLGLLSGTISNRFPRCTYLDPCSLRSSENSWNRSQTGTDRSRGKFSVFCFYIRVKVLDTGLDLAVDPFQVKRDLKWIRSSVNASKYGHGSNLFLCKQGLSLLLLLKMSREHEKWASCVTVLPA